MSKKKVVDIVIIIIIALVLTAVLSKVFPNVDKVPIFLIVATLVFFAYTQTKAGSTIYNTILWVVN